MGSSLRLVAFDLGASNGRAVLGSFDGERIDMRELHRFDNWMVDMNGVTYWDAPDLYRQMKRAFSLLLEQGVQADCFGVDTWGVDFGLLDKNGQLLGNPRCYRNGTVADVERTHAVVPQRTLFDRTGIASMPFNTVYQLHRRVAEGDAALSAADTLLFTPDLYGYFFTGEKASEYTMATTSMLYDGLHKAWDTETMRALGIPSHIFTGVDFAGTLRGRMLPSVAAELSVAPVSFAAVGTHDTASAVAAIPGEGSFAFCSSGTWSLFGVETDAPVLTEDVFRANFSNEGTVQGGFRPLKNIMGLWLIQECRRDWQRGGAALTWGDVVAAAEHAEPFRSIIDPDDEPFYSPGNMEQKIRAFCTRTGQPAPETVGQTARCIYESLALKYRHALETLETLKGGRIDALHVTGGGIQNRLLNQFAADSTGVPVVTGPVEGAALGNLLYQAVALGELKGLKEAREVARASVELHTYLPHRTSVWQDAYARLLHYMEAKNK